MQYALFIYEDEALYGPEKNGPAIQEIVAKHMAFNREIGSARIGGGRGQKTADAKRNELARRVQSSQIGFPNVHDDAGHLRPAEQ